MKYLTVGTDEIKESLFRRVEDVESSSHVKPRGGLWLTEFDERVKTYNHWVDFMMFHPNVLFYKSKGKFPWEQPCSLVTLRDDVNLFYLDNMEKFRFLMDKYPYDNHKFSYEALSKNYDGIFIKLGHLFRGDYDYHLFDLFSSFGVSSMVMFHLSAIDYYQSGNVFIEPFDYEDPYCEKYYEIDIQTTKKRILKR